MRKPAPLLPLTVEVLREKALAALARRALTKRDLTVVLTRAVDAWGRRAIRASLEEATVKASMERAREAIPAIVDRFVEVKLVDDAAFASARTKRLSRAGRSRRAIEQHLGAHGIDGATARDTVRRDAGDELRAALVLARKKRLGPFRREGEDRKGRSPQETGQKELASLARAGFDFETAARALRMPRERALELLEVRGEFD